MAWYRCGGGGLPAGLQSDMDTVLNKKFSTSTTYPPTDWPDTVNLMGPLPEKTASGAIAHIEDGADGVPLKNWLVTLPASLDGYTEVNGVQISSDNLLGFGNIDFTLKGIRYYTVDGVLYLDGTTVGETSSADATFKDNLTFYLHAGTYYLNRGSLSIPTYIYDYDDFVSGHALRTNNGTFTLAEGKKLVLGFYLYNKSFTDSKLDACVNVGSTAITYVDTAAPTTYTASLGRTIYGGTADIVTGEGSETYPTIKISDLTFVKDANCQHTFRCTNLPRKYGSGIYNIFSSAFTTYTSGNSTGSNIASLEVGNDNTIFLNGGSATFYITADSSYDNKSASDFVADFANTLLIYEASTPTPFTFTPITPTPETALGVSNWWADEGDSDVTYRADISLALQALGGGGRGLMMMRPTEPEETEETEETEGLEDELNR